LSALADELEEYDGSTGTVWFPVDQPLPRQLTARLIEVKLPHLRASA
jgi:uncharacterized protein YdhG (YjbR/CyaY superfamily)